MIANSIHSALQERVLKCLIGLIILLPLVACYVPDNFAAEIRITKEGNYGISYSGDLIWAPLFGQSARGEIEAEAAAEQIIGFTADLKLDGHFQSVASLGRGRFQVRYNRQGTIAHTQVISFVRRSARIFQLFATEEGQVRFLGRSASAMQAEQLENISMQTRGLFRIVTDSPVSEHNASAVRPAPMPGYAMYDRKLSSFRQPAPKLTLQLNTTLPTSPGV